MGARRGGEDVEDATSGSDIVGRVGVSLRVAEAEAETETEDIFHGWAGARVRPNSTLAV